MAAISTVFLVFLLSVTALHQPVTAVLQQSIFGGYPNEESSSADVSDNELPDQTTDDYGKNFDFDVKPTPPSSQQLPEEAKHAKLLHFHLWEEFKRLFNKTYHDAREELIRFQTFVSNLHKIRAHNERADQGMETFTMRMNKYGDLKHKEFVSRMNGYKRKRIFGDETHRPHRHTFMSPLNVELPPKVDWRDKGYVTAMKDQGHCGSCWAFSATGALEGQQKRKSGKLVSLSEQNLVDCSRKYGNEGCNGGLMDNAFTYIKENNGIDTEQVYPYEAKDGKCRFKQSGVGAVDYGFIDIPEGDEQKLTEAIATVGPISVAIDASQESFMFYHKGVYVDKHCSSTALDHGVLAIGYGTVNGTDYYLVKNSWGKSWGDNGYILMARNKKNMCGIATAASYPLV